VIGQQILTGIHLSAAANNAIDARVFSVRVKYSFNIQTILTAHPSKFVRGFFGSLIFLQPPHRRGRPVLRPNRRRLFNWKKHLSSATSTHARIETETGGRACRHQNLSWHAQLCRDGSVIFGSRR
jgi:hypothetical protein